MNQEKFKNIIVSIKETEDNTNQIGTLSEKTLHRIVKSYYAENNEEQEIKIGTYYADIYNQKEIIEIQTKQFHKLRNKLTYFLNNDYKVRVVYPTFFRKQLYWIDPVNHNIIDKRLSPKKGSVYQVFHELYQIKQLLDHPNLNLSIILMDLEEYRLLNGWSNNKKRGSVCYDRIPVEIVEEIDIDKIGDYHKLIPSNLPSLFTSKDFAKCSKLTLKKSQIALNVLHHLEVIKRIGKVGKLYQYELAL